jgi:hypothetical protein
MVLLMEQLLHWRKQVVRLMQFHEHRDQQQTCLNLSPVESLKSLAGSNKVVDSKGIEQKMEPWNFGMMQGKMVGQVEKGRETGFVHLSWEND